MVQVTKQAVQQWVMIDYLAQKHRFEETISRMERKYGMTLAEFEKHIASADKEVFEEWTTISTGRRLLVCCPMC